MEKFNIYLIFGALLFRTLLKIVFVIEICVANGLTWVAVYGYKYFFCKTTSMTLSNQWISNTKVRRSPGSALFNIQ